VAVGASHRISATPHLPARVAASKALGFFGRMPGARSLDHVPVGQHEQLAGRLRPYRRRAREARADATLGG
jgi:hypothetical protein